MSVSECENDFDCEGTLVCYVNVSWLLDDGIQSQCGCGTWNSYTGEDCLQLGPGAYYLATSASITGIMAFLGLLTSLRVLYLDFPGIRNLTFSSRATTNIYTCFGFLGFTIWRVITVYKALTPENIDYEVVENLNEKSKIHNSRIYEIIVIAITVVFGFVAILNNSLSWIVTVERVAKLNPKGEQRALRYKITILVFEAAIIAVNAILAPISDALLVFAVGFIMLCICALYLYGLCRLIPLLESSTGVNISHTNARYLSLIKLIKKSAIIMLSGVFIGIAGGVVFALVSLFEGGWKEKTPPGTISSALISNELIPLGGIVALLGVEFFLYSTCYYFPPSSMMTSKTISVTNN